MKFLKWLLVLGGLFVTPANAAFEIGDIICETTATTGTGTVNLAGAVSNYATFVSQITSGASVPYHIVSGDGKLETGIGTFTDATPDTLTRVANWSTDGVGAELTLSGTSTVCLGPIEQMFDAYVADFGLNSLLFQDADGIYDDSNNEQLIFQKTASAVNYLEIYNAGTGVEPQIAAAGSDTNVGLAYGPQGSPQFPHYFYLGGAEYPRAGFEGTADGSGGPTLFTYHNTTTPAANDYFGNWSIRGKSSTAVERELAYFGARYIDPTNGSEDAAFEFWADVAGTEALKMSVSDGVIIGSGTTFPGGGNLRVGNVELGADTDTTVARTAAGEAAIEGDAIKHAGRQTIPLTAGAGVVPSGGAIAGCTPVSAFDSGTQDIFMRQCSFSATADNAIYFYFTFPKSAAETTDLVARVDWTSATTTDTTDDVIWNASAVCFGNDDSIDANAFPADDAVTDTQTAAGDFLSSPEITAITPAGTPAEGDACVLRIRRDADNGSDNFNGTADLLGVQLYYTDNASSDD